MSKVGVTGRRADALFKLADKFYYGRYNGGDGGREASRLGMHPFLSELLRNFKDDLGEGAAPSFVRRPRHRRRVRRSWRR